MDKYELAARLVHELVQTPDTGGNDSAVNTALRQLRDKIETKIARLQAHIDEGRAPNKKWDGVFRSYNDSGQRKYENIEQFQIYVCKWSDLRKGRIRPVDYKPGITKVYDSSGEWRYGLSDGHALYPRDNQLSDGNQIGQYVYSYFNELFRTDGSPLASVGTFLDKLNKKFAPKYCVTLSLDFYYTRPLTLLGLHKDTTGNTLFVGLHYNNMQNMVGPEYMYDFWPKFNQRSYSPHHTGKPGNVDAGVFFWPKMLRDSLELARGYIKQQHGTDQDLLRVTKMSPHGLIAFVDELLFHQTPLTRRRIRGPNEKGLHERRTLFMDTAFNNLTIDVLNEIGQGNLVHQHPPRLRRQFSQDKMEDYWSGRGTGGQTRRSFVRFWAMIEPTTWFV